LNQEIEGKIAAVRSALQGTDIDSLRQTTQELSEAMQKVGEAVYGQQETPPPGSEPPPPGDEPPTDEGGEEGTVEGEFREV
jgi:molecular chaperone DnaK